MQPQTELQALLAVQIIATGFSGLRLLRQSQQHMTEPYIDLYGPYAIKLLRLQSEMIKTFDRYRRGSKQTVEVRHVHIHSGGQGLVGIVNPPRHELEPVVRIEPGADEAGANDPEEGAR